MKIKTGDKVKIMVGKDKGKEGKILQVFQSRNKASIEGLNLAIKHLRGRRQGEKGQRIEFPAPLDISDLLLICSMRCIMQVPTRAIEVMVAMIPLRRTSISSLAEFIRFI